MAGIDYEDVRSGVAIDQHNLGGAVQYKGVFDGTDFYLYRLVRVGDVYHGNQYEREGWVLAFGEHSKGSPPVPEFVPRLERN